MSGIRLSQSEFDIKFNKKCDEKLKLITSYVNKRTPITVECVDCGYQYQITATTILYKTNKLADCFNCSNPIVICDYCGKEFRKNRKEINKTSHSYCSIDCRNKAINDAKRKSTINNYRSVAFANYEHKCSSCGWNEDKDILEVHHIDENREHNELNNLIILCPICHRKLTSQKYILVNNKVIKK